MSESNIEPETITDADDAGRTLFYEAVSHLMDIAAGIASATVAYYTMNPLEARLAFLKVLLFGKRFSQHKADQWQTRADKFATWYHRQGV
jgi:hypothetical protein